MSGLVQVIEPHGGVGSRLGSALNVAELTGVTAYTRVTTLPCKVKKIVYNGGTNADTITAAMAAAAVVSMDNGSGAAGQQLHKAPSGMVTGAIGGVMWNYGEEGIWCPAGFGIAPGNATDKVTVYWCAGH